MKKSTLFFILMMICGQLISQPWTSKLPEGRNRSSITFPEYRKAFYDYWASYNVERGFYVENGVKKRATGWKQFKRWEYEMESKADPGTGKLPVQDARAVVQQMNFPSDQPSTASWTQLGPASSGGGYAGVGRLNCIAFHPSDNNTWWVGAASGGLWVTTNNGNAWSCLTDANGVLAVSDIVIPPDFGTTNVIYIATGDKDHWDNRSIGVLKSANGGLTWNTTGLSFTLAEGKMVNRLLLHPTSNQTLIAATSSGVYKTTSGGTIWNTQLTNLDFIDMEFKPGNFNTLYGSNTTGGIYRSIDGGANWTQVFNDGNARRIELAVSPNQPAWVYALAADNNSGLYGVFKSTDSGATFTQVFSGYPVNMLGWESDGSGTGGQGWYDLSLASSPVNANTVLVGGVNTWRSTNGGTSWSIVNHWWGDGVPAAHADKHWLTFRSNGDLFECNDGGVYISTDNGTNWTDKTNGMVISQMYKLGVSATVAGEVITGLQDNGTKLISGGTWLDVKGGDGMECLIDYTDVNIQYGTYVNGQISRTTNHWASATDIQPSEAGDGSWVTPYIIDPVNPAILYAGYADVWKTTDRGNNWTKISTMNTSEKIRSMAIAPSNTQVLYVADPWTIWKTTTGGSSWSNITGTLPVAGGNITSICVKNDDPNTLWVSLGGYNSNRVFQSINGGTAWSNISAGLPSIPAYSIVQNRQSTGSVQLYAGTELGVYFKNGANNWVPFNDGLPNVQIGELEIWYSPSPQNSKLVAATYGRGLWETPVQYTSVPMTYVSGTTSHPTTALSAPGSVNQIILKVEIQTNGDLSPLNATSFTFSTTGSTSPGSDLSHAKLFFTGTSNDFSAATQFGSTINAPSGIFTITGSQTLFNGPNYFWLVYDLTAMAVNGDIIDAQCNALTVGTSRTPAVIAPVGNRIVGISYCPAGSQVCDEYIARVQIGSIDTATDCSSGGYGNYTDLSTDIDPGETIHVYVTNAIAYAGDRCGIWVDWNGNGDFTDDGPVTMGGDEFVFQANITCPLNAMTGPHRMRIRIHWTNESTSPCETAYYGEVEDYTLIVNPSGTTLVTGTMASGESDCHSALQTIQVAGNGTQFHVEAGASVLLVAGQKISCLPGTKVFHGGYMRGYISPDHPWCTQPSLPGVIISGEEEKLTPDPLPSCKIYPNPTTGTFTVQMNEAVRSTPVFLELRGLHGELVKSMHSAGINHQTFSLEDRPSGVYFLRILSGKNVNTYKIIKY